MIRVKFPKGELTAAAKTAQRELQMKRDSLLEDLGSKWRFVALESFDKRSEGQPDVGITWEPLTSERMKQKLRKGAPPQIGVDTGRLRRSLRKSLIGKAIALEFDVLHAVFFSKRRQLFPSQFPAEWMEDLESAVDEWANGIVTKNFEEA